MVNLVEIIENTYFQLSSTISEIHVKIPYNFL